MNNECIYYDTRARAAARQNKNGRNIFMKTKKRISQLIDNQNYFFFDNQ